MDFILDYDRFNKQNKLDLLWNEKLKCIKIDNFYIFPDKELVLESGDNRLNELFGMDLNLTSLLPQDISGWTHLGVDAISGIISSFPIGGKIISSVVDMLHGMSYFVEAGYKESSNEKFSLTVCGIITLAFGVIPALGVENAVSATLKRAITVITKSGIGKFISWLIKYTIGLPLIMTKTLFKAIFNISILKQAVTKFLLKNQDTWIFKALYKVPVVKQIIDFFKKNLDFIFSNAEKYIAKDLDLFKKATISELNTAYKASYKTLDKKLQSILTEEQFVKANLKHAESELALLEVSKIADNPSLLIKEGKTYVNSLFSTTSSKTIKEITELSSKFDKIVLEKYPTIAKIAGSELKKQLGDIYLNNIGKVFSDDIIGKIVAQSIKKLPKEILKKLPTVLLKRLGIVAVKDVVTNVGKTDNSDEENTQNTISSNSNTDNTTKTDTKEPDKIVSTAVPDKTIESTDDAEFKKKYHLKVSIVDSISNLGQMTLTFRTPEKDGENGKLILEGSIFDAFDLTPTLKSYDNEEELLKDLKIVGKKDDNKTDLRDNELRKWEKSEILSTPKIKDDVDSRYEFHFLIRERSKISFFKKNHVEEVNLADMIAHEYTKLNQSLYVIVNKISNK